MLYQTCLIINKACSEFNAFFAIPSTILFFGAAIYLTIRAGFLQFTGFPRFVSLLLNGFKREQEHDQKGRVTTISSFHALFAAMASTIGMGNIVGPSVAIMVGGPGALFWLLIYIFFGAATKFVEVTLAMRTRVETTSGLVGGPMEYLKLVSPFLARWYSVVMTLLFVSWSSLQSNTLASILGYQQVPAFYVGVLLGLIVLAVVGGGASRVGTVASKLVPVMFVLYVTFSSLILLASISSVIEAFKMIFSSAFSFAAPMGAFVGATVSTAMQQGIYRSIFITEAGLGTSSISHAMSDAKSPTDQGLLALFSMISDAILSLLSGLIVLVTGVWTTGFFRSTLIYEAFQVYAPVYGKYILLLSIGLFVLTTVIGNTFNGRQSFASLTSSIGANWYIRFSALAIFAGALLPVQFMWNVMDVLLTLVAIPNIVGLLIIAYKKPELIKIQK